MNMLLDPSLVEAFRFFGAAAVVFAAALFYYRMIKKEGLKKQEDH